MEVITAMKCLTILVVISVTVLTVDAQAPPPTNLTCIDELSACSEFYMDLLLTPTPECCTPLENAYKTELPCLCKAFKDPTAAGINLDSGLELFKNCNITDASSTMCMTPPPGAPPKSAPKAPTGPKTPAANGAVYGAQWIGFCGFFTLFVYIFSFMA